MLEPRDDIRAIWAKPGRDWTRAEWLENDEYLNAEPQLTKLRLFCLRHLGFNARWQDAEDAWQNFHCPPRPTKYCLDAAIKTFDPLEGGFESYLLSTLHYFCLGERKGLRPLPPEPRQNEEGDTLDVDVVDDEQTPLASLLRTEDLERLRNALIDCVKGLPPKCREMVTLADVEGYSNEEIADLLLKRKCSEKQPTEDELRREATRVKVAVWRAHQNLKQCLKKKGIKP